LGVSGERGVGELLFVFRERSVFKSRRESGDIVVGSMERVALA
jgi:hypothetical protein